MITIPENFGTIPRSAFLPYRAPLVRNVPARAVRLVLKGERAAPSSIWAVRVGRVSGGGVLGHGETREETSKKSECHHHERQRTVRAVVSSSSVAGGNSQQAHVICAVSIVL